MTTANFDATIKTADISSANIKEVIIGLNNQKPTVQREERIERVERPPNHPERPRTDLSNHHDAHDGKQKPPRRGDIASKVSKVERKRSVGEAGEEVEVILESTI